MASTATAAPDYQRPAHPSGGLTVDHVIPLAAGGAPLAIGNCAVLCCSCHSAKVASADRTNLAR